MSSVSAGESPMSDILRRARCRGSQEHARTAASASRSQQRFCPARAHPVAAPSARRGFALPESYTPSIQSRKIHVAKGALEGKRTQVAVLFDFKASMGFFVIYLLCAVVTLSSCLHSPAPQPTPPRPAASSAGETLWITANGLRLKTNIYKSATLNDHPVLLVVLHGDSPFAPPSSHYAFARKAAAQMDNVVAVALLRPGYADETGERSEGERGFTTGDNYTPEVVDAVGQGIDQLKAKFRPVAT